MSLDKEDVYDGDTQLLLAQKCVTIRFCGSHNDAPKYYEKLMKYIEENKFTVNGFSREMTLIDYGMTNDTNKFVTEIAIPIE